MHLFRYLSYYQFHIQEEENNATPSNFFYAIRPKAQLSLSLRRALALALALAGGNETMDTMDLDVEMDVDVDLVPDEPIVPEPEQVRAIPIANRQ